MSVQLYRRLWKIEIENTIKWFFLPVSLPSCCRKSIAAWVSVFYRQNRNYCQDNPEAKRPQLMDLGLFSQTGGAEKEPPLLSEQERLFVLHIARHVK
jgi:hypothetical protein